LIHGKEIMARSYSPRRTQLAELKKWQQRLDALGWPAKLHRFWPSWFPADATKMLRIHVAKRCTQEIGRLQKELNEHVRA